MANFISTFLDNKQKLGAVTKAKEDLQAQFDSTSKELTDVKAELESVKQHLAALPLATQEWATEKESLISSHTSLIEKMNKEHATVIENLNKAVEEANKSAGKVARSLTASAGIEPETVKVSQEEIVGNKSTNKRYKITSTL